VLALVRIAMCVGCLGWAVSVETPDTIRVFIFINFLASLAEELALYGASGDAASRMYTVTWIAMSLEVYGAMTLITKDVLSVKPETKPSRAVALIVAGAMTAIVAGTMLGHILGPFDWLTVVDAAVLVFMGACVGMGASKQTGMWQKASLVLMAYWFAQALFEIGLTAHFWNPDWMRANQWFPAVLTCAGCVWIAHIARLKGAVA
jgi:hypothetical protein